MFYKFTNFAMRRGVAVIMALVALLSGFAPSVFADPVTTPEEGAPFVPETSNLGWIDLTASVPSGFKGSVFVQVRNVADDTYYDIESYVIRDFKNSAQVPLGEYVVEVVSTSEDPFLYDVVCDTETFTLTGSVPLHVTVTKNATGEAFLAGDPEMPDTTVPEDSEEWLTSKLEGLVGETTDLDKVDESKKESLVETDTVTDADVDEEAQKLEAEDEKENGRGVWQELLISFIGILVFGGIFFGIYFFSRRKFL